MGEKTVMVDQPRAYCLNCGSETTGKFCSNCGQSTSTPPKLMMKNFGKSVMMSFGRLTPGFFNTAKGLLFQPWEVIRNHIHGRQIRYSPPITMVIQVLLYANIIYTFIDVTFGTKLLEYYDFNEGMFGLHKRENVNPLLIMLDQSIVVQALILGIPTCFIIYLAYIRHGSRKYNFAEYLVAFVYMFAAINMYDFILNLIYVIPGIEFDISTITGYIAIVFSIIILIKAFPQRHWWQHILLIFWACFLLMLFVFIISIIIAFFISNLTSYSLP